MNSHIVILSAQSGKLYDQQSGIGVVSGPPINAKIGVVTLPADDYFIVSKMSFNLNSPIYLLKPTTRGLTEYPPSSTVYSATQTKLLTGFTAATGSTDYPLQDSLQVIDIGTRKVAWSQLQSGDSIEAVQFYDDLIVAVTNTGATAMELDSGRILWSRHEWNFTENKEVFFSASYGNTLLLGIGPADDTPGGAVLALDFLTGATKWSADIVTEPLNIATSNNSVFVAAEGQAVYALDLGTGRTKWIIPRDDAAPPRFTVG